MALDIEKQKLTRNEGFAMQDPTGLRSWDTRTEAIAYAATAKALWGIVDWLYEEKAKQRASIWPDRESKAEILNLMALQLVEVLQQAGIERPKGG